jgi:cytochrome c-type biogenesis protein
MQSAESLSIIVAISGGVLSFLSPCVLPLVPSYISYITGISFEDLSSSGLERRLRQKVVLNALFFVLGFSTVFIVLGASFSFLGRFFASHQQAIQKVSGLIIIFFGLSIAGVFKIPFLMRSKEFLPLKTKPAGYVGSTLIGLSFGSAWTPCIGPILGSILTLAGSSAQMRGGATLLTAYSIGFAIPFLLTAWASGTVLKLTKKFGKSLRILHIGAGIFLVIMGIMIFTGYFKTLNFLFIQLTPEWLLRKI